MELNLDAISFFMWFVFSCCLLKSLTSILFIFCEVLHHKAADSNDRIVLTETERFWVVGSLRNWKKEKWFSKDFDSQLKHFRLHWSSKLSFLPSRSKESCFHCVAPRHVIKRRNSHLQTKLFVCHHENNLRIQKYCGLFRNLQTSQPRLNFTKIWVLKDFNFSTLWRIL